MIEAYATLIKAIANAVKAAAESSLTPRRIAAALNKAAELVEAEA